MILNLIAPVQVCIGDVKDAAQAKAQPLAPWRVVFRFLAYALIANLVINFRSDVTRLHEVSDVL